MSRIDNVIPATPRGVARRYWWTEIRSQLFRGRDGIASANFLDTFGNWGFGSALTEDNALGTSKAVRRRQGYESSTLAFIPIVTGAEGADVSSWFTGRYGWEMMLAMPTATSDTGVWFSEINGSQPSLGGANTGVGIRYRAAAPNVVEFFSRNATGSESIDIGATGTNHWPDPANWARVRFEFRSRKKGANASVTVTVNDRLVVSRAWTGAHLLPTPTAALPQLFFIIGIAGAGLNDWIYRKDLTYYDGPDEIGVT